MKFEILGIPQSKQSAKFKSVKRGDKSFIQSYQPDKVLQNERNIAFDVKSQLPKGFIPYDFPVKMIVSFVFPIPKSFSKKKIKELEEGKVFYKDTKPDLTDNLMKGLCDAMNGIVYTDDARVCKTETEKKYGKIPRTNIEFITL